MAFFPRPSSPREVWADLRAFLSRGGKERAWGAGLALLVTGGILLLFYLDPKTNTAPPPTVIYAESFDANRTDAEIVADQQKAQAEQEARALERQRQYQELQNSLGIE